MQTGTRRRRSDSPGDDHSTSGPSKRPRETSPLSTSTPGLSSSTNALKSQSLGNMTQPTNGYAISEEGIAGPSTGNGHTHLPSKVQLEGSLMYADDASWKPIEDGTDIMLVDPQDESRFVSSSSRNTGLKGSKRMPVNREEVTRLMLQSLRDIGYQ
jgi:hypothetical protein